jgi:1-acyl-sn-glycerol-3-phosphate acyltransferase
MISFLLRKILQPFYTAYVIITFCGSVLLGFPFFALLSIVNTHMARRVIFGIVKYWAKGWLFVIGMPVKRVGELPRKGRFIIVANHISYLDTINIFTAIPGYFRVLGKKEISRVPIIGLIYKQLTILVDRNSPQSRSKSMRLLWRILKNVGNIVIFPEGTFNETEEPLKDFYNGAFRLAINTQTDILPMIFPDTVDRWHYSAWWKIWPGSNRVEFLAPVKVGELGIDNLEELKQHVYDAMEGALLKYRSYPAEML